MDSFEFKKSQCNPVFIVILIFVLTVSSTSLVDCLKVFDTYPDAKLSTEVDRLTLFSNP